MLTSHFGVTVIPSNDKDDALRNNTFCGGRFLIFAPRKTHDNEQAPDNVDIDPFHPTSSTIVVGEDVSSLGLGHSVELEVVQSAPIAFSDLAAGDYWVQAVLGGARNYARYGRGGGDAASEVKDLHVP